jgi:hypothetical protein
MQSKKVAVGGAGHFRVFTAPTGIPDLAQLGSLAQLGKAWFDCSVRATGTYKEDCTIWDALRPKKQNHSC